MARPKRSGAAHHECHYELMVSDALRLPDMPQRRPADRKCLCCGTVFRSSWAGNRTCGPCMDRGGVRVNDDHSGE